MTDKVNESPIAEFSMAISKANIDENGAMRWRSVNSDIEEDFYGEKMSLELFSDFDKHIKNNESVPEVFKSAVCEEDWCGGMPYLSIAHYKSGKGRVNVPGEPQSVYVDGKALKSKGILYDNPLGKAVFKSLRKDIEEKSDNKVRISIGFLDLEHEHVGDGAARSVFTRKSLSDKCRLCEKGTGTKIYKKGHLVHLALTRVPANPRTDIEVEKSMTTKLEDAKSIIQDEDIEKTLELKSQTEEVLVIKAEEPVVETPAETPVATKSFDQIAQENTVLPIDVTHIEERKIAPLPGVVTNSGGTATNSFPLFGETTITNSPATSTAVPVYETPLQKSFAALEEKAAVIKSQGLTGDNALKELQPEFEQVGTALKAEFTAPPSPQEVANQNMAEIVRSTLQQELPQILAQRDAPIHTEMAELRALILSGKTLIKKEEVIPQPRSLNLNLVQKNAVEQVKAKMSQFDQIAQASVGLQ